MTQRSDAMPKQITIGEKYSPAMEITEQAEADAYFDRCVRHSMMFGHSEQEAERIERANLGYYAGYYDTETRERVERLFKCSHPIFGAIAKSGPPSAGDALWAGVKAGSGL